MPPSLLFDRVQPCDIVPNMALEKIIKCYRGVNDEAGARDVVLRLQKKSKKYKRSKAEKSLE